MTIITDANAPKNLVLAGCPRGQHDAVLADAAVTGRNAEDHSLRCTTAAWADDGSTTDFLSRQENVDLAVPR
ncbi:hypothetical protein [Glutamicibacter nicotianae]|uniref:hypothetical protein n=1 Tax=Glutamicibacter nicotianae TaxID=37929 RepID=UPI000EF91076|nr:hypothetical protein [Glutamicibacter nicotianae]